MSEDIVRTMFDAMSVRTRDEDAVSGADEPPTSASSETLPHVFCKQLENLLTVLSTVFPENTKLTAWLTTFKLMFLDKPAMEEWVIKKWHYDMTHDADGNRLEKDLYALTRERNIEALLSSDLWVFKEISARDMYFDTGLDDTDRESLCKHFDNINSYAKIFSSLPDGMREAIERVTSSLDLTQEITHDTMTHVLQNMLNGPDTNMEQLMSWASQMVSTFADGQGLDALQTLMSNPMVSQATGGLNISQLMGSLQTELAGGLDGVAGGGGGAVDPDMLMRCMSILGMGGDGK